jgi:CubicO group peptidase (beta-lactamase class C family)
MKMSNGWFFLLFLTVLFILNSCQDNPHQNKPAAVVAAGFQPVDNLLNQYVEERKVSGGVGLVYAGGEMKYHKAFGFSNTERKQPMQLDAIFRIASMTKPITSVAAMLLYEEGKFKLDDPVAKYLPEFGSPTILERINRQDSTFTSRPARDTMTIEHLFTFTSGLYYAYDNDSLWLLFEKAGISEGFEERDILLEDNIRNLAKLPLLHEPGERYHYGVEMDVLGRLVEVWSGMPLDQFLRERLFDPLGMEDTYFFLPEEKVDRLVSVYASGDTGIMATDYPLIHYPVKGARKYLSGGADLSCTAWDYFLFCRMMLNKGQWKGQQILQPETVELMSKTHLETGDNDMGLGFGLLSAKTEVDLARSVGSITWGGFFTTIFWIDPVKEVIGILMLQMYPFEHWQIQKDFEERVYQYVNRDGTNG